MYTMHGDIKKNIMYTYLHAQSIRAPKIKVPICISTTES